MKSGVLVLIAIILILFLGTAVLGLNDFRMTNQTGLYSSTLTNPTTSANLTLVAALYNSDITNVTSVTSNNTSDSPLAAAYTSASKVLRVDGLQTDASRALTVVYKRDNLGDFVGASIAATVLPILLVLAIFGLLAGAVVTAINRGE